MKQKKKKSKLNKLALTCAIAFSVGQATFASDNLGNNIFSLKHLGSYSDLEIQARCGEGSCASKEHSSHNHATHEHEDEAEASARTNETCEEQCEEKCEGKQKRRKCIKKCIKKNCE